MNVLREKNVLCTCICALLLNNAFGQQVLVSDSIFTLEAVIVEARRLKEFSTGSQVLEIDATTLQRFEAMSMSELLAQTLPIFIKAYNPGSLATTSIRGMGASHTAVLWNGFPIQSSMNGQIDFSLLPNSLVDAVQLQLGGEGALWGSGAVGGTLYLENLPDFSNGWQASMNQTLGSFGKHFQSYKLSKGSEKSYTSLKFFRDRNKNNFPYTNNAKAGFPRETMQHALFSQWGLLFENYLKIKANQQLAVRFWGQNNDRQIPATLTTSRSQATQEDRFIRTLLTWSGYKNDYDWKVQSGFSKETLFFKDDAVNLESLSKSSTLMQEAELNWRPLTNFSFQAGVQYQYISGETENYEEEQHNQQRLSLLGSVKYQDTAGKLESRLSIRQEFTEYGTAPIVPTWGVTVSPWAFLSFSGKVARSYRLPTFNDLYWQPGGNINLLPESGWSQEVGSQVNLAILGFESSVKATVFSNRINNWILWRPGASFWSPENVQQVWARGIETALEAKKKWDKTQLSFIARYHFTRSTNEKQKSENDRSLGKQLIYTPEHTANFNIALSRGKFEIGWQQQYTGKRYTASDHVTSLSAFTTGNFSASIRHNTKLGEIHLSSTIFNLFNETYQVMAWRPMPERNYQFSIILKPKF
ncbi:MAG: TonB-dependent receptor plug domain-containing protein [Bacteroidota bacterium]